MWGGAARALRAADASVSHRSRSSLPKPGDECGEAVPGRESHPVVRCWRRRSRRHWRASSTRSSGGRGSELPNRRRSCADGAAITRLPVEVRNGRANFIARNWMRACNIARMRQALMVAGALISIASSQGVLPDRRLTPGAIATSDAVSVCRPGAARSARRRISASTRRAIFQSYKRKPIPGICCELDHLIPLELGGSTAVANLWPQPYEPRPGAREKDTVERQLHALVCSGRMSLAAAQAAIANNWVALIRPRMRRKRRR